MELPFNPAGKMNCVTASVSTQISPGGWWHMGISEARTHTHTRAIMHTETWSWHRRVCSHSCLLAATSWGFLRGKIQSCSVRGEWDNQSWKERKKKKKRFWSCSKLPLSCVKWFVRIAGEVQRDPTTRWCCWWHSAGDTFDCVLSF